MKRCLKCCLIFQESSMTCTDCGAELGELTLTDALDLTRKKSFKRQISGTDAELPDNYKQYLIRSYLGDHSLFLLFDLSKNRLKHGRKPKRFLIQPVDFTAVLNIPWFLFNIISSNLFHLQYTAFCEHCDCKCAEGNHTKEACQYNVEYFNILDDILSGEIVRTKKIYAQQALENVKAGKRSAFADLFLRKVHLEVIFDFLSIGLSVAFWVYIAVFVSLPMFKLLLQKLEYIDSYEWSLPKLTK